VSTGVNLHYAQNPRKEGKQRHDRFSNCEQKQISSQPPEGTFPENRVAEKRTAGPEARLLGKNHLA
jgi:hypothetical protein